MTTHAQRPSATIYDFTERARAILAARGQYCPAAGQVSPAPPTVDFGSGWYHDAAIREADRTRKP